MRLAGSVFTSIVAALPMLFLAGEANATLNTVQSQVGFTLSWQPTQVATSSGIVTSASATVDVNATYRAFQLSPSQALSYRAGVLADVSAAHPTVIYAMTSANSLYRDTFTESACGRGLHNDGDLLKDGDDPDCP